MVVIFDDAANTLEAQEGSQAYNFRDVSNSSISISGYVDDVSLAIDRSSLGVVLQHYVGAGKVAAIEFGQCQRTDSTAARP